MNWKKLGGLPCFMQTILYEFGSERVNWWKIVECFDLCDMRSFACRAYIDAN